MAPSVFSCTAMLLVTLQGSTVGLLDVPEVVPLSLKWMRLFFDYPINIHFYMIILRWTGRWAAVSTYRLEEQI